MLSWLSFSGWGRERVSLVFEYMGCQYIEKGQWHTKVNILRLALGYLNVTMNIKTRNPEPEIGTDVSSQTRHNPRVDRYGSRFGWPRSSRSGFWSSRKPNQTIFAVRTRTTRGLPRPIANTSQGNSVNSYVGGTPTSWALGGLYCHRGGGWMRACAGGIQDRIWFSV